MAHRIKKNFISPKNAWHIYQNVWLPSGQYSLACTTWTKKECENLMSPFLNAILPKLGLNRHFPRVVIHGVTRYWDFQMAHFYIEQGYLSIKFLLSHIIEELLTSQHFMILLSQVQLVSESAWPFLTEVESNKKYAPHLWLSGMRRFFFDTLATIQAHQAWLPNLQQENKLMLMDVFETAKLDTATLDH
eukprot:5072150-Ditylum_brightwellii.AAC.1